jgi:dolichol kinase
MFDSDLLSNTAYLVICYLYVLFVIAVSGKLESSQYASSKVSRKFLHMMIGNILFVIPFFTFNSFPMNFPFFVALPFVLVTFLATRYSPLKGMGSKLRLGEITNQGDEFGLVFYAISFTTLAFFFANKPYVIAAGILPMAYGDASASLFGEKFGNRRFHVFAVKSFEGSLAMFCTSFLSIVIGLLYFSAFYSLNLEALLIAGVGTALVATMVEAITPFGFDNLSVPLLSALSFLFFAGLI